MKLKVVSVFDTKVETYGRPFVFRTLGEATRMWVDSVNDPESPFYKHPGDYALFVVAEFDESTGQFENLKAPQSLGLAIEFRNEQPQMPRMALQKNSEEGAALQ